MSEAWRRGKSPQKNHEIVNSMECFGDAIESKNSHDFEARSRVPTTIILSGFRFNWPLKQEPETTICWV